MDGGGGRGVCRVQRLVFFSMGIRKMMWCHIKKAVMNYHSHKFISCSRLAQGLQLELEGGRVTGETLVGVYRTLLEVSLHNLTFKLQACNSLMIKVHMSHAKRTEAGWKSEGSKHFKLKTRPSEKEVNILNLKLESRSKSGKEVTNQEP